MERFLRLVGGRIEVKEFPNREHRRIDQPFLLYNEDDFLVANSTCSSDPVFCNYGKKYRIEYKLLPRSNDGPLHTIISKVSVQSDCLELAVDKFVKSTMKSLINGTTPTFYQRENTIVTEKSVFLGKVCIHRQFEWNTHKKTSFLALSDSDLISLTHEILVASNGQSCAKIVPSKEELPDGVYSMVNPSVVNFSWKETREKLFQLLWKRGHFMFLSTMTPPKEPYISFGGSKNGFETIALMNDCQSRNCIHCGQDICVWELNKDIILNEVDFLISGPFLSVYHPMSVLLASSMCMMTIQNQGRPFFSLKLPKCIRDGCKSLYCNRVNTSIRNNIPGFNNVGILTRNSIRKIIYEKRSQLEPIGWQPIVQVTGVHRFKAAGKERIALNFSDGEYFVHAFVPQQLQKRFLRESVSPFYIIRLCLYVVDEIKYKKLIVQVLDYEIINSSFKYKIGSPILLQTRRRRL